MTLQEFIERLKYDKTLQSLLGLTLISSVLLFIFVIKPLFFTSKPKTEKLPCYNVTLKVWSPFKDSDLYNLVSPFTKYCVNFKFTEKSLEEIKKDLILALAGNDFPDIVYLDNEYLNEYSQFFATPTIINVDALVAYYNKDVLNFFQLKKPRTMDELKDFIKTIKSYQKENFYPVGLGTQEIKNRGEIILSLMTLNPDYNKKEQIRDNLYNAFSLYTSFNDPQSEFFSYSQGAGDDLTNFAQEKLALYLGFYQDKKEILTKNPRLNYEIFFSPLNTFPPKAKSYTRIYYFAPVKKGQLQVSNYFLQWFSKNQIQNLADAYDLVPYVDDENLASDKKIVLETVKNQGETFDFINKKAFFENIDNLLTLWQNKSEFMRALDKVYYSIW